MANDEPKAAARLIYKALPAAEFSGTTLRALATAIEQENPYENLPNSVKICLIRLGMACRLVDLPGLLDDYQPKAGEVGPADYSGPVPAISDANKGEVVDAEVVEKQEPTP